MKTLNFDNTLIEVKNYPICFTNAKLNLWERFFKGSWKTSFELKYGTMKQTQFEQLHLHSCDIGRLTLFLDSEIDILELQRDNEMELPFLRDLMKALPPMQETDVWFLFQKKVEIMPQQLLTNIAVAKDFEREEGCETLGVCDGIRS